MASEYSQDTRGVAPKASQVVESINSVDGLSGRLMGLTEELNKRLASVLRDEPTAIGNPEAVPAPPLVPLSHSLECSCCKLRDCIGNIESILHRLEL